MEEFGWGMESNFNVKLSDNNKAESDKDATSVIYLDLADD